MNETTLSPLISGASATDFLIIESGSLAGQRFPLPQAPGALLLGRERMCNVRFDPEKDRVVGRAHARIEMRLDGIYLVDLNSANGTFRSDGSAVRGEVRLSIGERFQLGGEGGPWLWVQSAGPQVAVHVAPPPAETPTLITPPAASASAQRQPRPVPPLAPQLPSSSSPPGISLSIKAPGLVPQAVAPPLPIREVESRQVPRPEPEPSRRLIPELVDPLMSQHQKQYRRQVAIIVALLVLACSVGLAMGLREHPQDDEDEIAHSE